MRAEVVSPASNLVALLAAPPIRPFPSVFGDVAIDLSVAIPLVFGAIQPPSELTQVSLTVPNQVSLRGRVLGLQAVDVETSSLAIELSNVGVFVVR